MSELYFAYGSNLNVARLRRRVASARVRSAAWLADRALTLDKRGADGSGKANLAERPGARVWGVLYEIDVAHWPRLDRCEPGYLRVAVSAFAAGGARCAAQTYVSRQLTRDPLPFSWYKRLMIEGAREHGLPEDWLALLEGLPERCEAPDAPAGS